MTPSELERIATQAGWIFREDGPLVVTAEPPQSLIYDVHAVIIDKLDTILASKAKAVYHAVREMACFRQGAPHDLYSTIDQILQENAARITPDAVSRMAALTGYTFTLDTPTGDMFVQGVTEAKALSPSQVIYHHDTMHLELLRAAVKAFESDWFNDALDEAAPLTEAE